MCIKNLKQKYKKKTDEKQEQVESLIQNNESSKEMKTGIP